MSTAARFSRLTRLDAGRIDTRTLLVLSVGVTILMMGMSIMTLA